MTKEAGFTQTIIKDTKIVSSAKTAQSSNEVKTAPSLFDSMLDGAKQTEKTEINVASSSSSSAENKTTSLNSPKVEAQEKKDLEVSNSKSSSTAATTTTSNIATTNLIDKSTENSLENISVSTAKSVSLLDKLIQEATQSVKDEESLKIENKQTENSNKNIVLEEGKKTSTTSETTDEKTKSNSLLDKLLEETNTSIKKQSTLNDKTQLENGNVAEKKLDASILKQNKEVIPNKNENLNITTIPTLKDEQNKTNINIGEQKNSKELTSSLLDKLVQDANTTIQKEATKTLENKESKNITNIETTQNIKDIQTKEVKTLEQVSQNIKELVVTKETTITQNKVSTTQTQIQTTNNVNEKVANELAKISENSSEKTTLNKEQVINLKDNNDSSNTQKEAGKSLMDRLLQENKATQENVENQKATSANSGKTQTSEVLNNIYLSSLNKASQNDFLKKTQEVKTIITNATSVKDVQKGADLLNLNLQKSEVILEDEQFKQNVKNDFLNKLSINRDIIKHDITKMSEAIIEQSKSIKSETTLTVANNLLASKNLPEVEVTLSPTTAYNIENRIIGARQNMNTMMSDMARNMYLNYKPPVTAFRMNLSPGNLGSIAVLIKNDKTNGLSISLNMSSVATMDSFVDNQAALRAALAKNFDTTTNINLEFNMNDGQQQENSGQQQNKKQQKNHQATNDILESLNNKSEITKKVTNYM